MVIDTLEQRFDITGMDRDRDDAKVAYSTLARVCVTELDESETDALIAELSAAESRQREAREAREKEESARRRANMETKLARRQEAQRRKDKEMASARKELEMEKAQATARDSTRRSRKSAPRTSTRNVDDRREDKKETRRVDSKAVAARLRESVGVDMVIDTLEQRFDITGMDRDRDDANVAYSTLARVCVTELGESETDALIAELSAAESRQREAREAREKEESARRRANMETKLARRQEAQRRKDKEMASARKELEMEK